MESGIHRKIALVCGASRGIGAACAKALADEGAATILVARNVEMLVNAVEEIRKGGGDAQYLVQDLARIDELEMAAGKALSMYGRVDILVNNTGGPPAGDNLSFGAEVWEESFRGTFLSAAMLTRHLIHHMSDNKWGRIINLTSISVKQPIEGLILSNSIRMAVVGWAKTLSREFAAKGVTINNVATGYTLTERLRDIAQKRAAGEGRDMDVIIREMAEAIPMKRMAEPGEIADLVVFLASERASYITGITVPIDGGFAAFSL
jgi:3-oxoacyl-[acyl-carrier protein] reductase